MSKNNKGFVPLWRDIQDHWIWKFNEPFDHRSAWMDLIMLVNHKENKIPIGHRMQTIKPGQRWLSYAWLGKRWKWSYRKVMRFMELLRSDDMVYTDGTPNGTLLTIVNWAKWASYKSTDGSTRSSAPDIPDEQGDDTPNGITDGIQTTMNNNDKKMKNNEKQKEPSECPGKGWYWSDIAERWMPPPTGGGEWQ